MNAARPVGVWGPSRSIVSFGELTFGTLLLGTGYALSTSNTLKSMIPLKNPKSEIVYSTLGSWGGPIAPEHRVIFLLDRWASMLEYGSKTIPRAPSVDGHQFRVPPGVGGLFARCGPRLLAAYHPWSSGLAGALDPPAGLRLWRSCPP